MSNFNHAYIFRGVPGSGKSTAAHAVANHMGLLTDQTITGGVIYYSSNDGDLVSAIHSTDTFFLNKEGEYQFNPRQLGLFHGLNFKKFKQSLSENVPIVICDNTNTTRREYIKYLEAARRVGYITSIVTLPIPSIELCVARNSHGVPEEAIIKMIKRWEPYSGRKK